MVFSNQQFSYLYKHLKTKMKFIKRLAPKLMLVSSCSFLSMRKSIFMSEEPMIQQVIRGQYENKIRRYSSPQKIFDVFATIRQDGLLYMTLHDLLKAICFYNFSVSDQTQTNGYQPKAVLQLVGKKQKFEFYDYFILVRFLAFERKKIEKYFEDNLSGKDRMEKQGFKKYLLQNVCADYNQFIKQSIGLESRQFKPSLKNFDQSIDETVQSLFEKRPNGFSLTDLVQFRRNIIKQLFGFQFLMFKHENQQIDGIDFARSIIKYVETSKKNKYMNRVKQYGKQFQNVKIGMDSYIGFHYYIQTNIDELVRQLNSHGAIDNQDVYGLINKFDTGKGKVLKEQIDILVKILDIDDSGFIQKKQFLGVLENLQYYTQVKSGQQTFTELMQQDWIKIKTKAKKILEVLQE